MYTVKSEEVTQHEGHLMTLRVQFLRGAAGGDVALQSADGRPLMASVCVCSLQLNLRCSDIFILTKNK